MIDGKSNNLFVSDKTFIFTLQSNRPECRKMTRWEDFISSVYSKILPLVTFIVVIIGVIGGIFQGVFLRIEPATLEKHFG